MLDAVDAGYSVDAEAEIAVEVEAEIAAEMELREKVLR